MKRVVLAFLAIALLIPFKGTRAQDLKTEVYVNEHIPLKSPIPYPHVREADVMWSKVVWRIIDLREKQNLPLYYPTEPLGGRMNITDILLSGIDNEGITAWDANSWSNEFKIPLTKEDLDFQLDGLPDTTLVFNVTTNLNDEVIVPGKRKVDQVKKLMIKEKWYFDKQHSRLMVRIIGICPMRVFFKENDLGEPTEDLISRQVCWVYYPEARAKLAKSVVYNRNNDAQQISFDDFLQQRRFSSYIFAESNVYDNRAVNDYSIGVETMYESDRIKNSIMDFEHDLWEF